MMFSGCSYGGLVVLLGGGGHTLLHGSTVAMLRSWARIVMLSAAARLLLIHIDI